MGWDSQTLPDRVKERMDKKDRPRGNAGKTFEECEQERLFKLETDLHKNFWNVLRRHGFSDVEYSSPRRSTRARPGRPDFLVCRNSRRLGIEFKIRPNKLSPEQEQFFEMARSQGNACVCCYDLSDAIEALTVFFGPLIS
jgi:hypothetical protein